MSQIDFESAEATLLDQAARRLCIIRCLSPDELVNHHDYLNPSGIKRPRWMVARYELVRHNQLLEAIESVTNDYIKSL